MKSLNEIGNQFTNIMKDFFENQEIKVLCSECEGNELEIVRQYSEDGILCIDVGECKTCARENFKIGIDHGKDLIEEDRNNDTKSK